MRRSLLGLTALAAMMALTVGLFVTRPKGVVVAPEPIDAMAPAPITTTSEPSADEIEQAIIGSIVRSELPTGAGFGPLKSE